MRDKQVIEEIIRQWNNFPCQIKFLAIDEKRAITRGEELTVPLSSHDSDKVTYRTKVEVTMQDMDWNESLPKSVIHPEKTVIFRHEWSSYSDFNNCLEHCYEGVLRDMMFAGISNIIEGFITGNLSLDQN